jgi:hypothetical protein
VSVRLLSNKYLGGTASIDNPNLFFNYHPLFNTIGFTALTFGSERASLELLACSLC